MKRITLVVGHYGSGKSNFAVNYALYLRQKGLAVSLADIDIVNPYFRSADSRVSLEKAGVRVISLPFANTNVDLPALPSEVYGLVERRNVYGVLDIGGDDRGAYALGRFVPYILAENDYEMLYVVNYFRPLTSTAEEALEVMQEIESACGVRCTGIVNNSNLGKETTKEDVLASVEETGRLSEAAGIPVVWTSFDQSLDLESDVSDPFPMKLQHRIIE